MKTSAFGIAALIFRTVGHSYPDGFNAVAAVLLFPGFGLICFGYRRSREQWETEEYGNRKRGSAGKRG